MSEFDIISDQSKQQLTEVPDNVLRMYNLKMLYLEGNSIEYLPDDIFTKLGKLNWLDLRNNKLRFIPKSIAYHENLENLLLSNNYLEKLPNELGLVPKLKVLQVSQNPLIYPCRTIITDGIQSICSYLRSQYLTENSKEGEADTMSRPDAECLNTRRSSETSVYTDTTSDGMVTDVEERNTKTVYSTVKTKKSKSKFKRPEPAPIITITSLSKPTEVAATESNVSITTDIKSGEDLPRDNRIVHEITRRSSQISLKSYYKKREPRQMKGNAELTISDAQLKEHWLEKIKAVLAEQERILQQEKNLMALKEWRDDKKIEAPRYVDTKDLPKPPYDIQEEYMTMASRADLLNNELEKYAQKGTNTPRQMNIESLIAELVNQLKELEDKCTDVRTPRHEIEEAAKQIKMIMNIHQKIQNL
ncbi:hypothetical protein HHI36_007256, partial [Cryptolaemus montrouzieri]